MIEFLDPTGLLLGAAAAGVLSAHLIRRRAKRHTVPFLPLWMATLAQRPGGFGAAIARWLDLLLVVLACGAVALAAGGPQVKGTPDHVRDLVLVLDGGVSLRAGTRLARLQRTAEAEIRRRAPGAKFVVVGVTDEGASLRRGADVAEAVAAVRAHPAGWTDAPRDEAVELGRAAAKGLREPDVVFVTHRRGRIDGMRLRTVVEEVKNAGVASLAVVGDPEGGGAVARLTLRGDGMVSVEGKWEGEVFGTADVDVPLEGEGEIRLVVKSEADGFAPDDAVYFVRAEPPRPRVLVLAAGEPSTFLAAALQALESTGMIQGPLDRTTPDHAAEALSRYDLLVFDRCAPPERVAGTPALYVFPSPGALPFRVGDEGDGAAFFDVKKEHPLLLGFDLLRVAPPRARAILGGEALATAGPGPVIAAGPGWVALGFDPEASIFAASPAYPLFLRNAVEFLAPAAATAKPEFYAVGEVAPEQGLATIEGGATLRVGATLLGPPGFWRLPGGTIAVDFLARDLDLAPPEEASDALPDVGDPGEPALPLAPHFAAGAIALLLLAWWAFWRSP